MDSVIQGQIVKKLARSWKVKVEDVEKYYILGWILWGIQQTALKKKLAFKGGTAISKVYFPSFWRLSEDLDFTLVDDIESNAIIDILDKEIPEIVQKTSGIALRRKENDKPLVNAGYIQYKMRYVGPLYQGMIKIEVTKEVFVGDIEVKPIPNDPKEFDYSKFSVQVYSLETIVSEKMRAIIERGYIRDYYDVWRLLKEKKLDREKTKKMFHDKCKTKQVKFSSVDDFFPKGIDKTLEERLPNLARFMREPLPSIKQMLNELRKLLEEFLK